jgi:secreted trypsin-like serine protease
MTRVGFVCGLGFVLAACSAGSPIAAVSEAIVAGKADSADSSVVLWYAQAQGATTASLCTAEVISAHVVLTAAHCVSPDSVGPGVGFAIMPLADIAQAGNGNFTVVDETHYDPAFVNDITAIQNQGHDIAVGIFKNPIGIAPLSYNHTTFGKSYVGQSARIVGYGVTVGGDPPDTTSAGVRRVGSAKVTAVNDVGITLVGKTNDDCEGDSGGPGLIKVAGKEVIAGVTSYGDKKCTLADGAVDTNVTSYTAFIDQYVDAVDPPTAQGAIGAACSTNRDCASQICGSDGKSDYCMQACDSSAANSCPVGYYCGEIDNAGFCIQGTKPKGGCDFGGGGDAPMTALLLVGVALLLRRRARL